MNQYIIGAVAIILLLLGIEQYGEHRVQVQWDTEKAKIQAVSDAEKARNLKTIAELNEQHKREVEYAKSKAGRDAVNRWLREHGLLSDGAEMRDCASPSASDRTGLSDAGREEQGTGTSLEGFAINCADDASRLTDWQTLCKYQGCVVE